MRTNTRKIKIGNENKSVYIGGGAPIVVQSMTNTDTKDVAATVAQIKNLERAGCEIVRSSIPDEASAFAIKEIKKNINIPLVADIHFDHKLALLAIEHGADKIRINPGNMRKEHLDEIIKRALDKNIAIRVGVNSGSLKESEDNETCHPESPIVVEDRLVSSRRKSGRSARADLSASIGAGSKFEPGDKMLKQVQHDRYTQKAKFMAEKALEYVNYFEQKKFKNLVVSLKSSDVETSLLAYKFFTKVSDCPLHLGITEAGSIFGGTIKSSVGLALILNEGLGDTIRVSLSADPVWEVRAAYNILASLGLRQKYPNIVSCPTCARTTIDVVNLVAEIEKFVYSLDWKNGKALPITIAVMGCIVNGPGEAKEADFGVSGAGTKVAFFEKGKIVKTVEQGEMKAVFNEYLKKYL